MPYIQVTQHPSCGTGFGRICKTTIPSSWWCVFLYETTCHGCVTTHSTCLMGAWSHLRGGVCCYMKPHFMAMFPLIPRVLWAHRQGLTSLWHNEYTVIIFCFCFVFFFGYVSTCFSLSMHTTQKGQHFLSPVLLCSSHCCCCLSRKLLVPPSPQCIHTSLTRNALLVEL